MTEDLVHKLRVELGIARRALTVIAHTPHIERYLRSSDPQALAQVQVAEERIDALPL